MKKELENDFIKGNPSHKKTVQDSHAFVSNHKFSRSNFQKQHEKGKDHEGLAFAQQGNGKNDNDDDNNNNNNDDDKVLKHIMCCLCGEKGHVATRCPQKTQSRTKCAMLTQSCHNQSSKTNFHGIFEIEKSSLWTGCIAEFQIGQFC